MSRPQVSTNVGVYSIAGGFLNVFNDVKLEDFTNVLSNMTFGELIGIVIPFAVGLYSIWHKEKV